MVHFSSKIYVKKARDDQCKTEKKTKQMTATIKTLTPKSQVQHSFTRRLPIFGGTELPKQSRLQNLSCRSVGKDFRFYTDALSIVYQSMRKGTTHALSPGGERYLFCLSAVPKTAKDQSCVPVHFLRNGTPSFLVVTLPSVPDTSLSHQTAPIFHNGIVNKVA